MSETILSLVVPITLVFVFFAGAPLLRGVAALERGRSRLAEEEMPDLREDDTSPHLTRETA